MNLYSITVLDEHRVTVTGPGIYDSTGRLVAACADDDAAEKLARAANTGVCAEHGMTVRKRGAS